MIGAALLFLAAALVHALWRQSQSNAARRRLREHHAEMRRHGLDPEGE